MRLALYQPDIPQNLGAAIRLSAAFETVLDVIEPCGFPLGDKAIKRAALDYGSCAKVSHHVSWEAYLTFLLADMPSARLVLFTTKAAAPLYEFSFRDDDILLMGRESAGVPDDVHARADARLFIPICAQARSINVTNAAAMALGEALRQTNSFPARPHSLPHATLE
ncbi:tRNA (cytidine(34)-2'-O)-methyltransferase [Asticcacaulis sp. MM231]|uniref:tRNA (cytidine(34)-2'-O)-methyltransferase n=1 Tax=Asticcacaulis sp. MM231 TaxID=3157666 RepID=UPI0032D57F75